MPTSMRRMKSYNAILVSIFLGSVHSYVLRCRTLTTISPIANWQRTERWTTGLCANKDSVEKDTSDKLKSDANSSKEWEMMEDWILQDRVPEFTVRGNTFWRQLKHTIPELSSRSEQELQERYNQISSDQYSNTKETKLNGTPFVDCGDSPEVLSTWWMDVVGKNSAAVMMMHGRLSSGSNIWFPLQSAGTIGGNNNNNHGSFQWLLEDGDFTKYVESSAGCIYELGTPKPNSMDTLFDSTSDKSTSNTNILGLGTSIESLSIPTTNLGTTVTAAIASSVLSAFLAFNLGQASLPTTTAPAPTPVTSTAIVKRQSPSVQSVTPAVLGSGMKYERTLQTDGSVKIVEMSIGEQRASQELKIFREERRITNLQEKLQTDQLKLKELSQQEVALGPEEAAKPLVDGVPRSPRELSISEQRARAEIKVGIDQRQIQRTQTNLSIDKQKLKELQIQEKQQQRQQLFSVNGK